MVSHADITILGVDFKVCKTDSPNHCLRLTVDKVVVSSFTPLYAYGAHQIEFITDGQSNKIAALSGYVDFENKLIYARTLNKKNKKIELIINLDTLKISEFEL